MADIIDKIGKHFAEQEQQLRQVYVQTAPHAALPPTTYHRTTALPPRLQQYPVDADTLPGCNSTKERQPPLLPRRRLSQQSDGSVSGATASDALESSAHQIPRTPVATVTIPAAAPPLVLSPPPSQSFSKPRAGSWDTEDVWSEVSDDGFASWRSMQPSCDANLPVRDQPHVSAARPEVEPSDEAKVPVARAVI